MFLVSLGKEFNSFVAANANALLPYVVRDLPDGDDCNISSLFCRLYLQYIKDFTITDDGHR